MSRVLSIRFTLPFKTAATYLPRLDHSVPAPSFLLFAVSVVLAGRVGSALAWTPELNLTPQFLGPVGEPAIAMDGSGRVHCVYLGQTTSASASQRLYYRYLDGATWSATQQIPTADHKQYFARVVAEPGGALHVIAAWRWNNGANGISLYYFQYNGVSWSGPTLVAGGSGDSDCTTPRIARDRNGDLHLVWSQGGQVGGAGDIMYRKRQAGVWQPVKNLTANRTGIAYGSVSPDLAVDLNANTVHVVWHDDVAGEFQVFYTKNSNLGDPNAWLPSAQWALLSTQNANNNYGKAPLLALDRSNYPHVFWIDKFGGSTNVMAYRRWEGSNWSTPLNLGTKTAQGAAFDRNNIMHLIYTRVVNNGPMELFYQTYNFSSFSSEQLISAGPSTTKVDYANLTLDDQNNPHVLWEERKVDSYPFVFYSEQISTTPPGPRGTIAGLVRDQFSQPLLGVAVAVAGVGAMVTDATGSYSLSCPVGTHTVSATRQYYATQQVSNVVVTENQTSTVNFTMTAIPPGPVTALAVRAGNTTVRLTWTNPSSGNCTGTMIRFKTSGYPTSPTDGALVVDLAGGPLAAGSVDHNGLTNGATHYYAAFAHDDSSHFSTATTVTAVPFGPGDYDRDGDVDQSDFGHLQSCYSGPAIPQTDPSCQDARFDGDDDVDLNDFAIFQGCMSGPGIPAAPGCAD